MIKVVHDDHLVLLGVDGKSTLGSWNSTCWQSKLLFISMSMEAADYFEDGVASVEECDDGVHLKGARDEGALQTWA